MPVALPAQRLVASFSWLSPACAAACSEVLQQQLVAVEYASAAVQNDRFISNRSATDFENANLLEQLDTGGSVRINRSAGMLLCCCFEPAAARMHVCTKRCNTHCAWRFNASCIDSATHNGAFLRSHQRAVQEFKAELAKQLSLGAQNKLLSFKSSVRCDTDVDIAAACSNTVVLRS